MKVVACIKQVPDTMGIALNEETGLLKRDKESAVLNPFDAYALEEGLQTIEELGGELWALTMGPPDALAVLHEAISMGIDSTVHICDEALRGSDSYATARVLSAGIQKLDEVDLVLCGCKSIDGDTAQVGPQLAEMLGWPHVAYVKKIRQRNADSLIVERLRETGVEVLEVKLPALLTVLKDINIPRMPSFKLKLKAKREVVPVWDVAALGLSADEVGSGSALTKMTGVRDAEPRPACQMLDGSAEQMINTLLDRLDALEL